MSATIHDACQHGDVEAVRGLIAEDRSLVDADDEHRWRPIFHAALRRHIKVVRVLIAAGADLAAHDGDAIHYASETPNNKEVVALLVKYGALEAYAKPTSNLSRQLHAALFLGDADRVRSLLRFHPDLARERDGRGDWPLHHAARSGETEIVKLLLDAGADVHAKNPRGHTVLYCAGGHGHLETVRAIISRGADVNEAFTHDGLDLEGWLKQYPNDARLQAVAKLLEQPQQDR